MDFNAADLDGVFAATGEKSHTAEHRKNQAEIASLREKMSVPPQPLPKKLKKSAQDSGVVFPLDPEKAVLLEDVVEDVKAVQTARSASGAEKVLNDAFTEVAFGTKVSRFPIDKFRVEEGKTARIALLACSAKIAKYYWVPALKRSVFHVAGVEDKIGYPTVKYIVPILQYHTDNAGEILSKVYKVKFIALWERKYTELSELHAITPIDTIDLKVVCTDEQKQYFDFVTCTACTWKTPEWGEVYPKILESFGNSWPHVKNVIASEMSADELIAHMQTLPF